MIIDPYMTTMARAYRRDQLVQAVTKAALADECRYGLYLITERDEHNEPRPSHNMTLPKFTQPLLFNVPSSRDPLVALDLTAYKGRNSYVGEQVAVAISRAKLTLKCAIDESASTLYSSVPQLAYANIVAGLISYNYGIEGAMKGLVTIITAAHYYNMTHSFKEKGLYTESEKAMLTAHLVKLLRMPTSTIQETLEEMTNGSTIEELIANVQRIDHTERTKGLNVGIIVSGAAPLWYGVGATETIGVALEHAPTWCALLNAVLGDGGYSREEFARRLKYISAIKNGADNFRKHIRDLELEFE